MNSLFDQDRAFWRFINKTADLVILNVVFILCCIPIITIGPAYTALYYTIMKTVKKGRGYAMKNFWHSFKQNFVQGATIWLVLLLIGSAGAFLLYNVWETSLGGGPAQWIFWLMVVVLFFILCILIYVFPVLSRFAFGTVHYFAFSYLIAVRYFLYTILLVLLLAVFVVVGVLCNPIVVIILPALYAFISSELIEKIFAVYMPKFEAPAQATANENADTEISESEEDNQDTAEKSEYKDQWYYD